MNGTAQRSSMAGAVAWMMGAIVSLTAMALAGRELSAEISIFEIMFFRNAICLAIVSVLVAYHGRELLRTQRLALHGFRNVVHFGAQFGWFYALAFLPLAEVFAIEFTAPLWTAILAALFLSERLTAIRVGGIVLGFVGILIILKPGVAIVHPAAFAVLGAAIGFASTFVITKSMITDQRPLTILFYMNLIQLPLGMVPAL
ncbi:MAG: DMT family transporter, partial [Alphaproteobacteria bacterium]|nr:DMT family transporter [Alphaproteobacteria bacterium]